MKKAKLGLLLGSLFLATAVITFGSDYKPVEGRAADLPLSQQRVAPAGINAAHSYTNSPTNEPWYSTNHYFTNTSDPVTPHTYAFNQRDTTYSRMNVSSVWDSYRGEGVKVAVIDTGCQSTHEDFSTTNFTLSKNTYANSTSASSWNDSNGHGTASAATIAAAVNSVGGSGIAPNVQLIVLKAVDGSGAFSTSAINNALDYCITNQVDVINMSIQGYDVSANFNYSYTEDWGEFTATGKSQGIISPDTFTDKINACYNAGITVVASAGNFNTNRESYPAANDHVIAVASTGMSSANKYNKAGFSNYGSWVDISAPGYVTSPYITSNIPYTVQYGTSFSAPLVTGAIALFKSKYPYANPDQIEKALKETAYSIDWQGGAGAINVGSFLNYVPLESIALSETEKTLTVGDTYNITPTFSPSTATNKNVSYESSDPEICTVNSSGVITAVSTGNSIISVTSNETGKIYELIEVNVEESQSALEVYKTVTFTSSTMSEGTQAYTNVSFTNTCDGITTTVQNANNNQRGWDYIKFGSKSSATTGSLVNTTAIDKAISQIGLTFTSVSNVSSAKLYVANNSSFTGATEISFTPSEGVTTIPISNPIQNGYYKIVFEMSQSSGNGPLVLTKIEYYTGSSSVTPSVKTLSSIAVTSSAHRTFTQGDSFVKETITATYSDTSTANVTNSATFSGYNMSNTGNQTVNVSYTEGGVNKTTSYSITVNAPVVTNYTVTFNSNGGTGNMSNDTTSGSSYIVPECSFTRTNYSFSKWALGSVSGNQYAVGETISNISGNITLYAIWSSGSSSTIDDNYGSYYSSITSDLEGTDLRDALNILNGQKRTRTMGYDALKNYGKYTEIDWTGSANVSGKMFGFYDNALVADGWDNQATWNREHVWPKSLGGNTVEGDMHMVRPASVKINSERGNKYYGSGSSNYDPGGTGLNEYYRGVAARIIFYCAIANKSLKLADSNSASTSDTMGKLSDLLQWNLTYAPDTHSDAALALRIEQNRNKTIYSRSDLQGNRNPFVDHPEYACRIWGNTNSTTKSICGLSGDKTLSSITITGTPTKTSYTAGESFDSTGLTVTANFSDSSSQNVTSSVVWTPNPLTEGITSVTASYTYGGTTKTASVSGLTVSASSGGDSETSIEQVTSISTLVNGDKVYIATGLGSSDKGLTGWNNSKDATVSKTQSEWKEYTVEISSNTVKLKDGNSYIATPGGNEFKYGTSGASITLDNTYHVKIGNRWLCENGTYYRCYESTGSYALFYLYKKTSSSTTPITGITASVSKTYYVGETIKSSDITVKDSNNSTVSTFTFADDNYQFTYLDASSGGELTNKVFFEKISGAGFTCSLTVQVQRKSYQAPSSSSITLTSSSVFNGIGGGNNDLQTGTVTNGGITYAYTSAYYYGNGKSISFGNASNQIGYITNQTPFNSGITNVNVTSSGRSINIRYSTDGTNWVLKANADTTNNAYKYFKLDCIGNSGTNYSNITQITITKNGDETANNLSNYLMFEDTNNQCTTKFSKAKQYFESLTTSERSTFMTSDDYVISNARERLLAWAANQGKTITISNGDYVISNSSKFGVFIHNENSASILLVIMAVLTTSSLGLFICIKKRKEE